MDSQFPEWILYPLKSVETVPVGTGSCLPVEAASTRTNSTIRQNDFLEMKLDLDLRLKQPAHEIHQTVNHLLVTVDKGQAPRCTRRFCNAGKQKDSLFQLAEAVWVKATVLPCILHYFSGREEKKGRQKERRNNPKIM